MGMEHSEEESQAHSVSGRTASMCQVCCIVGFPSPGEPDEWRLEVSSGNMAAPHRHQGVGWTETRMLPEDSVLASGLQIRGGFFCGVRH